jgi:copper chaperone
VKFSMKNEIPLGDVPTIEHAMKTVDGDAKVNVDLDAKTVNIDSWLMPEEFLVAFEDEDQDVIFVDG